MRKYTNVREQKGGVRGPLFERGEWVSGGDGTVSGFFYTKNK